MATYTTILGDTWDSIAWKAYGDDHAFEGIMDANRKEMDTLAFSAGVELEIPEEAHTEDEAVVTDQARWREVMASA